MRARSRIHWEKSGRVYVPRLHPLGAVWEGLRPKTPPTERYLGGDVALSPEKKIPRLKWRVLLNSGRYIVKIGAQLALESHSPNS